MIEVSKSKRGPRSKLDAELCIVVDDQRPVASGCEDVGHLLHVLEIVVDIVLSAREGEDGGALDESDDLTPHSLGWKVVPYRHKGVGRLRHLLGIVVVRHEHLCCADAVASHQSLNERKRETHRPVGVPVEGLDRDQPAGFPIGFDSVHELLRLGRQRGSGL